MAIFLFILSGVSLIYGIAMGFTYPAGVFFLIWFVFAALFGAIGWLLHTGTWAQTAAWLKCGLVGILAVLILFIGGVSTLIFAKASIAPPANLDYLVVLGAMIDENGSPKSALRYRLDVAVEYLNNNPDTICIVSGGQGDDEPQTEASAMKVYLQKKGISASRILEEDKSTTTAENLEFSKKLIDSSTASVGVVTNNFHVWRSLAIARKVGLNDVYGLSSPLDSQYLAQATVRECFAIAKEVLTGAI